MKIDEVESRIHECLIGISDLAKEYVGGEDVRDKLRKELDKLDGLWGELADAIIEGTG